MLEDEAGDDRNEVLALAPRATRPAPGYSWPPSPLEVVAFVGTVSRSSQQRRNASQEVASTTLQRDLGAAARLLSLRYPTANFPDLTELIPILKEADAGLFEPIALSFLCTPALPWL